MPAPPRVLCCLLACLLLVGGARGQSEVYRDFNYGQDTGGDQWTQSIKVSQPALRSSVSGDVEIRFQAPGMQAAWAMCWRQPTAEHASRWGHDARLEPGVIELDEQGRGAFTFPAAEFPHGPTNVRIYARNGEGKRDVFELQLYNTGGADWNAGAPKETPPGAKGMKLLFADDFDAPLSISPDGRGAARYTAHKPGGGDFSGWQFANPPEPFEQVDSYLKIKARKTGEGSYSGLIASVDADFQGVTARAPCYLECRFTGQSAPGTWPAFWTLTLPDEPRGTDELDICEAYGGVGAGNPNHPGYSLVSHFWNQELPSGEKKPHPNKVVPMMELGGKSYWSTTMHTYAVRIGKQETVYYFDNIEVFRHATNPRSLDPHFFLINYAIGGISGWSIDLERYGNASDMYVDFVRVYQGE